MIAVETKHSMVRVAKVTTRSTIVISLTKEEALQLADDLCRAAKGIKNGKNEGS